MSEAITGASESIVREAPDIEQAKVGLMASAKAQADAAALAASQGRYLTPDFQIAGMSPDQLNAMSLGRQGIGAYLPYMQQAAGQFGAAGNTVQRGIDTLEGADTRGQFGAAQGIAGLAAQGMINAAQPIGQSQIQQYMNPYSNMVLQQQLAEINRQGQIQGQGMQAQAVKAGAFGGSREGIQRAELGRNLAQTQNKAIADSLNTGYNSALTAAQQQQQQQLAAYGQLNTVGQGIGSLAQQQFGIGSQLAQGYGQMGTQQGNLATQGVAMGQSAQNLGQGDTNFLYNMGTQQQKQYQTELDAARQNTLNRNMQPYQQMGFVSDIYKGAPSSQMAVNTQSTAAPSPFQQAAGLGIAGTSAAAAANRAGII
jgi:hypothetical protein